MEEEPRKYKPYVPVAERMNVELSVNEKVAKLAKNFEKLSLKNKRAPAKKNTKKNKNKPANIATEGGKRKKRSTKKRITRKRKTHRRRKTHHRRR
jgi:hypothetical protein